MHSFQGLPRADLQLQEPCTQELCSQGSGSGSAVKHRQQQAFPLQPKSLRFPLASLNASAGMQDNAPIKDSACLPGVVTTC